MKTLQNISTMPRAHATFAPDRFWRPYGHVWIEEAWPGRATRQGSQRIVTFVEIDRCATDAVHGRDWLRLGKPRLSSATGQGSATSLTWKPVTVRVAARDLPKRWQKACTGDRKTEQQQMLAYRECRTSSYFKRNQSMWNCRRKSFPV